MRIKPKRRNKKKYLRIIKILKSVTEKKLFFSRTITNKVNRNIYIRIGKRRERMRFFLLEPLLQKKKVLKLFVE